MGMCYEQQRQVRRRGLQPDRAAARAIFRGFRWRKALKVHERHADLLMDLDERVAEVIAKLKERGFVSPYLRAFVIARINPLRWMQGEPPPLEDVLKTMRERAGEVQRREGEAGRPGERWRCAR